MNSQQLPDYMLDMDAVLKDVHCKWDYGKPPDYSKVNELYFKERTKVHSKGSLEEIVSNLVKNWDKEAIYKVNPKEWRTMDSEKFRFSANGGKWYSAQKLVKFGPKNVLIGDCEYYAASELNHHSSFHIFKKTFTEHFPWECIEVYSPPPKVAFKWRHWGKMTGPLECPVKNGVKCHAEPNGKTIEVYGITIATINDNHQITQLETYFNPNEMFKQFMN